MTRAVRSTRAVGATSALRSTWVSRSPIRPACVADGIAGNDDTSRFAARGRIPTRSNTMNALQAQDLARQRHAEASTQARKALLVRAVRADRRAARATRSARAATERLILATR